MADNRITQKRIKHHLTYSWWKYVLAAALCIFGIDMLFAMTAYRPPEDKKIELYMLSGYCDAQVLQQELWPKIQAQFPEQEALTVLNINLTGDDPYANMQFSTYVAAHQGDVCLIPAGELKKITADGADNALLDLTEFISSGAIDVQDIDLSKGMLQSEAGVTGVYAIPADSLYGLLRFGCDPADSYLCVLWHTGNAKTAAGVIARLIADYRTEKPEGYGAQQTAGVLY